MQEASAAGPAEPSAIFSPRQIFGIALVLYPASPLFLVGMNFRTVQMRKAATLCFLVLAIVSALFGVFHEDVLEAVHGSIPLFVIAFYLANVLPAFLLHRFFLSRLRLAEGVFQKNARAVVVSLAAAVLSVLSPFALYASSHTVSVWLTRQGYRHEEAGRLDIASGIYEQGMAVAFWFRHHDLVSAHYLGLGRRRLKAGDTDGALAAAGAAEIYAKKAGSKDLEKHALRAKGEFFIVRQDYAAALAFTLASSRVEGGPAFQKDFAPEQVRIGALYLRNANPSAAVGHLQQAQAHYRKVGEKHDLAVASAFLGSAYADMGQADVARTEYLNAVRLYEEVGAQHKAEHLKSYLRGERPLGYTVP